MQLLRPSAPRALSHANRQAPGPGRKSPESPDQPLSQAAGAAARIHESSAEPQPAPPSSRLFPSIVEHAGHELTELL